MENISLSDIINKKIRRFSTVYIGSKINFFAILYELNKLGITWREMPINPYKHINTTDRYEDLCVQFLRGDCITLALFPNAEALNENKAAPSYKLSLSRSETANYKKLMEKVL